ncbi:MAG: thiamine-phosphate kinase [Omnitrophica bacterium RIFCSPLOWO2_01_FULL_45_10]|nr:MAG: thiamine-phosphate kinase [Omnitrophica bacterium RIFCSPLOWO2_01_FULL_45_10]
MKIKELGEIELIKRIAKRARLDSSVIKGIGDDAAVLRWTNGKRLLFTCDMLLEDVHFKMAKATPFQIGWKAIARNMSDIAAMGGMPKYAVVSIGMSPALSTRFLDELYRGIRKLADMFKVNIVGGDMSRSKKLTIDISMIGEAEKRDLTLRSGAIEGDVILVTGSIGGSIKGRHLNFIPRLSEAQRLVRNFKINSMIDISDGLVLDLWRILNASCVGGRIYENTIPISKDASSVESAIYDGEDYELLFTMSVNAARRFFKTALERFETPVTLIGEIMNRRYGYKLIKGDGKEKILGPRGFLQF